MIYTSTEIPSVNIDIDNMIVVVVVIIIIVVVVRRLD